MLVMMLKVIEMEKTVETSSYDDFVKQFPANDCRYAIYDLEYELGESGQRNELIFVVWYVSCVCVQKLVNRAGLRL